MGTAAIKWFEHKKQRRKERASRAEVDFGKNQPIDWTAAHTHKDNWCEHRRCQEWLRHTGKLPEIL